MSPSKETKSGIGSGYLHGFSKEEQERLYRQAQFLGPAIFKNVHFENAKDLIEVGCGVGAQTEILLEKFPNIRISGIDASPAQIAQARRHLEKSPHAHRVEFFEGDASHLPFKDDSFDASFVCWFLEHVETPVEILEEIRRVLRPRGTIFCNETHNAAFYAHPYSPATLKYWFEFNDHQWTLKGDPFIGGKLANILLKAGFQNIQTQFITEHYDNRTPKARGEFIEFWTSVLLSAAPALLTAGRVTPDLVQEVKNEMACLKKDADSVIIYSWVQASAQSL